ncbi:MAG TPA: hypothetical protein VHN82_06115, partial [Methanoregula sp.]|nr:hypothetical protein [Methanoregula sp.]
MERGVAGTISCHRHGILGGWSPQSSPQSLTGYIGYPVLMTGSLITPEVFAFVIVPVLIFLARVCDMSLDTIRVIFVSKGIRYL